MELASGPQRSFGSSPVAQPDSLDSSSGEHSSQEHQQEFSRQNQRHLALADAAAGAAAGALAKTVVSPLERVKLLMQLRHSVVELAEEGVAAGNSNSAYSNAWETAGKVWREQGFLSFWRGNSANVVRQAGNAGLNFVLMDHYRSIIRPLNALSSVDGHHSDRQHRRRNQISSFLSGGLAGGTATTVLYPFEFMRTRLAMDVGVGSTRTYPRGTMREVFCSTLQTDGMGGLYRGYGVALSGVVLYRALHLGGYDAAKSELAAYSREGEVTGFWTKFGVAQAVSLTAGTICYPIDSVRRRLMMQSGLPPGSERRYNNAIACFAKIWQREGLRGFYLGIFPNMWRSVGGAVLLVSYDEFKAMVH
eukprot:CAMPEP_0194277190 /NCGR_PEP_ID=MMETSP0169-20130528/9575_1 /TAXON_ID=218684 /ORGANISM="Corethron pennatum, Strain L29A3" /LENGTH=361 /DNA_ID=CAMNT_0039021095 /DNA_START=184 /DNA_END=1269 /DNA_ORIENTATION=-